MKLWLLKRIGRISYDEYNGKVVRASDSDAARQIANMKVGDEGNIWTDDNLVSCVEIDGNGDPDVLLESFNAG